MTPTEFCEEDSGVESKHGLSKAVTCPGATPLGPRTTAMVVLPAKRCKMTFG